MPKRKWAWPGPDPMDYIPVIYEFDATQWDRYEAWRVLWEAYLNSEQYRERKNPFRKCHEWNDSMGGPFGSKSWRWTGPMLSPRVPL